MPKEVAARHTSFAAGAAKGVVPKKRHALVVAPVNEARKLLGTVKQIKEKLLAEVLPDIGPVNIRAVRKLSSELVMIQTADKEG